MERSRIGIVVIGRNEGARLIACLASLKDSGFPLVYVDSASSDGSQAAARALGADVVDLDMRKPFNAARARNEGFERLKLIAPELDYVQFVDGDCEVDAKWLAVGSAFLDAEPQFAVVCGRRREKFPEATKFNAQCDREWNSPVGEAEASGGDAMMRISAIDQVGGFDSTLIAHEEPELAMRLRAKGWRIYRIDAEMTLHDAALTAWSQVFKRSRRGGFGLAQVWAKHQFSSRSDVFGYMCRSLFWGAAIPFGGLIITLFITPWALLITVGIYGLQFSRLLARGKGDRSERVHYALTMIVAKFGEARGNLEFFWKSISGGRMDAIIYKPGG
jgi:glycosyltransferase involved in cell wall biosynthesis